MFKKNNPQELNAYWQTKIKEYRLPKKSTKRQDLNDVNFFDKRK